MYEWVRIVCRPRPLQHQRISTKLKRHTPKINKKPDITWTRLEPTCDWCVTRGIEPETDKCTPYLLDQILQCFISPTQGGPECLIPARLPPLRITRYGISFCTKDLSLIVVNTGKNNNRYYPTDASVHPPTEETLTLLSFDNSFPIGFCKVYYSLYLSFLVFLFSLSLPLQIDRLGL
jgi:hypothetical protein